MVRMEERCIVVEGVISMGRIAMWGVDGVRQTYFRRFDRLTDLVSTAIFLRDLLQLYDSNTGAECQKFCPDKFQN